MDYYLLQGKGEELLSLEMLDTCSNDVTISFLMRFNGLSH